VNLEAVAHALGQDYARFGLRRDAGAPEAFLVGHDSYSGRSERADYFTRKWLGLRLNALRRGLVLDEGVSPAVLRAMTGERCPVSLRPFDIERRGRASNPSLDRVINDGTYALGNLVMISQRINRAKGELSFEDVVDIAESGETIDEVEQTEWMRLASLMYGAWNAQRGGSDPYLVPLATYPPPFLFTPPSQAIQWLLLRAISGARLTVGRQFWLSLTERAVGSAKLFEVLAAHLEKGAEKESYLPSVWLDLEVFEAFEAWYRACRNEVDATLVELRPSDSLSESDVAFWVERWHLGRRQVHEGDGTLSLEGDEVTR